MYLLRPGSLAQQYFERLANLLEQLTFCSIFFIVLVSESSFQIITLFFIFWEFIILPDIIILLMEVVGLPLWNVFCGTWWFVSNIALRLNKRKNNLIFMRACMCFILLVRIYFLYWNFPLENLCCSSNDNTQVGLSLGKSERISFVKVVLKLIDRGQYSKNESLAETVAVATSLLSYVEPALVLPFISSRFELALETVRIGWCHISQTFMLGVITLFGLAFFPAKFAF